MVSSFHKLIITKYSKTLSQQANKNRHTLSIESRSNITSTVNVSIINNNVGIAIWNVVFKLTTTNYEMSEISIMLGISNSKHKWYQLDFFPSPTEGLRAPGLVPLMKHIILIKWWYMKEISVFCCCFFPNYKSQTQVSTQTHNDE